MIDLRSDTLTRPTPAMRAAMAATEVGDDVYGEDPTVARLERRTAALLGKEAALFVPSGTMANQLALRCHTEPGDEILAEAAAHIVNVERGAPAALSGLTVRTIASPDGVFDADDLGRGHGRAHGGGRAGEGIAMQVDRHGSLSRDSSDNRNRRGEITALRS